MAQSETIGAAKAGVRTVLRLEGAAFFGAATLAYFMTGGAWWVYLLLLFVPDLSFVAYVAGDRIGSIIYNAVHSYVLPLLVGAIGVLAQNDLVVHLALIHLAHIGLDRSFGYGLKYASGFKHTHLGQLGRA